MKISYSWLKRYADIGLTPGEVADLLTDIGLEVENISTYETVKGSLKGLVIGEVLTCIGHPGADRLWLTTVNVGGNKPLQIVCGAPNVSVNQKVVVAREGSIVHSFQGETIKINKTKIRGEYSEGMICAEDEIGLGPNHDGIMVLDNAAIPGTPASEYFSTFEDTVFDLGVTPNRADALSHIGVARDLVAAINLKHHPEIPLKLKIPLLSLNTNGLQKGNIKVSIQNPEDCSRYCGISIRNIKVSDSPAWLKNYLPSIGLRPVNNIVDAANFVMFETGEPLHTFNARSVKGNVIVRKATIGESIVTLDGKKRVLNPDDLLICNESEPMCMAGVFGGIDSGVQETTKEIFIESACFNPLLIRRTAKRHSLATDATYRFERGVDITALPYSLIRAAEIILESNKGAEVIGYLDIYPKKIVENVVQFSPEFCRQLIGFNIPNETMLEVFKQTGFECNDKWQVIVPAYRLDVLNQHDLVEEILRFYGYNNIPIRNEFQVPTVSSKRILGDKISEKISTELIGRGFFEITNLSFTSSLTGSDAVTIANPLNSELNSLRVSMISGGLQSIANNKRYRIDNLKLFEYGRTYHYYPEGKKEKYYNEIKHLALWASGNINDATWLNIPHQIDFYFLKSIVDMILDRYFGTDIIEHKSSESNNYLYPCMTYSMKHSELVSFGRIRDKWLSIYDLKSEVWYADFLWDSVLKIIPYETSFKVWNNFPSVSRDLAIIIDKRVSFAELKKLGYEVEKEFLKDMYVFDVFENESIGKDKKSYAIRFILKSDKKTLTDKEIDNTMNKLMEVYRTKAGADIRTE